MNHLPGIYDHLRPSSPQPQALAGARQHAERLEAEHQLADALREYERILPEIDQLLSDAIHLRLEFAAESARDSLDLTVTRESVSLHLEGEPSKIVATKLGEGLKTAAVVASVAGAFWLACDGLSRLSSLPKTKPKSRSQSSRRLR
jgi:hypothetical protein